MTAAADRTMLAAPLPRAARNPTLDIVRGAAIFGILLENMLYFGGPSSLWQMDQPFWPSAADQIAIAAIRWLEEGKFYSLFSFLFGLGVAIQMQREAAGPAFARLHLRRMLVLLVIGILHATLLWWGDVLVIYAVLGLLLLPLRRASDKMLLRLCLFMWLLPVVVVAGVVTFWTLVRLVPAGAEAYQQNVSAQQEVMLATARLSVLHYGHGTWHEIFGQRLADLGASYAGLLLSAPMIFMMFVVGLYVGRRGWWQAPQEQAPLLRRIVTRALPLGLLCHLAYVLLLPVGSRSDIGWAALARELLNAAAVPAVTFGYVAALVLLLRRPRWQRWLAPLATVGQMSLTNYLLQSLICTTLFYSYGFGRFGQIGPLLGLVPTAAIYLAQIAFSVAWLRRFRFGPAEWLWRALTYGQVPRA